MELAKKLRTPEELKAKPTDDSALGFGRLLSDHMYKLDYKKGSGWHNARIEPYGPLALDPAALVLHYGQEVFEGLKAYIGADGGVYMFRPADNMARMNRSCRRLVIPEFPEDEVREHMFELIRTERAWIPKTPGTSLYVRPTIIALDPFLGVAVGEEYLYYIIVGPVGAYYSTGFAPTKIYVEEHYVRSVAGGMGDAKSAGNYAASLLAAEKAKKKGYAQVLWLDACDKKGVEEVGTSNMFFKIGGTVITPPLSGSILPGITRDSVLKLCQHFGIPTEERKVTIDEAIEAIENGAMEEAWATGTAAVVSPVGVVHYKGKDYTVNDNQVGPTAQKLYDEIIGIQMGTKPDPFGWVVKIG